MEFNNLIKKLKDQRIPKIIVKLSKKIDDDSGVFGAGFLLCTFTLFMNKIKIFQRKYDHFPYDDYIAFWDKLEEHCGNNESNPTYRNRGRNDALKYLLKNKYLTADYKIDLSKSKNNKYRKMAMKYYYDKNHKHKYSETLKFLTKLSRYKVKKLENFLKGIDVITSTEYDDGRTTNKLFFNDNPKNHQTLNYI